MAEERGGEHEKENGAKKIWEMWIREREREIEIKEYRKTGENIDA